MTMAYGGGGAAGAAAVAAAAVASACLVMACGYRCRMQHTRRGLEGKEAKVEGRDLIDR